MYCPVDNSERCDRKCTSKCCILYNFALGFLAALVLAAIGLILGVSFAETLTAAIPLLIASAVILFIIFLVTLITRGCCDRENTCG